MVNYESLLSNVGSNVDKIESPAAAESVQPFLDISKIATMPSCAVVAGSIILPNIGGWANGLYFAGQIRKGKDQAWYDALKKPSWNPPKWVFGPAWTVLYSSMGYASYLVWEECDGFTEDAVLPLSLYGGQLLLNWAWTPIFFGLKDFKLAFIEIAVLSGAATATAVSFYAVNKKAGLLLLPYLAWLGYASSISYYIWKNNKSGSEITDGSEKTN